LDDLYDAAVIGGGPGGYSAAIRIAQRGGRVILFEKDKIGGTCLNVGCIPTKSLLEKASLLEIIRKNTNKGILKDAGLFSWRKIQEEKDHVVEQLTNGVVRLLQDHQVKIIKGQANLHIPSPGDPFVIEMNGTGHLYSAVKVILSTGSKVFMPGIKGLDTAKTIDSTGALTLPRIPSSMVIIGGGVIGVEFASLYSSFGTTVTVLEMLPTLIAQEDQDVRTGLSRALAKHHVRVVTGARVDEIITGAGENDVCYYKDNQLNHIAGECVLVAVGRVANLEGIDAAALGLELDAKGFILVNQYQETSMPGILAVGDVTGGAMLAHSAYAQADAAAENCMGGHDAVQLDAVPRCIYSHPQVAAIGLSEEQALLNGFRIKTGRISYDTNGKALVMNEQEGFVKVVCDQENGRILGVHILGASATEMIGTAVTAIRLGATIEDFARMIFPHPTLSELVREGVLAADGLALHQRKDGGKTNG
jgi:dihydrolipoamide dehydrogenase